VVRNPNPARKRRSSRTLFRAAGSEVAEAMKWLAKCTEAVAAALLAAVAGIVLTKW